MDIVEILRTFMENEARSCPMDFGYITPEYVYRMWGGRVAMGEIANAMSALHFDQLGINRTQEPVRRMM